MRKSHKSGQNSSTARGVRLEALEQRRMLTATFVFADRLLRASHGIEFAQSTAEDSSGDTYVGGMGILAKYASNGGLDWHIRTPDYSGGNSQIAVSGSDVIEATGNVLSEYDSSGNLLWQHEIGSQFVSGSNALGQMTINAVAGDGNGNVFITGQFTGTVNFSARRHAALDLSAPGNSSGGNFSTDAFVAKFNSSGVVQWADDLGGQAASAQRRTPVRVNSGTSIQIGNDGSVYTTGTFQGTANFNPGGTDNLSASSKDVYLSKLDTNGAFAWANDVAAAGSFAPVLSLDSEPLLYDFTGSTIAEYSTGGTAGDIVTNLLPTGATLTAATVTPGGHVYLTGTFSGNLNFNVGGSADNMNSADGDMFLVQRGSTVGHFIGAVQFGGADDTTTGPDTLAADPSTGLVIGGSFTGSGNFDPMGGTDDLSGGGSFLTKLDNT